MFASWSLPLAGHISCLLYPPERGHSRRQRVRTSSLLFTRTRAASAFVQMKSFEFCGRLNCTRREENSSCSSSGSLYPLCFQLFSVPLRNTAGCRYPARLSHWNNLLLMRCDTCVCCCTTCVSLVSIRLLDSFYFYNTERQT